MSVLEIEKTIKPLSITEKQQLIQDVQRMIDEELKREAFAAKFKDVEELSISPGFEIAPEVGEALQKVLTERKA